MSIAAFLISTTTTLVHKKIYRAITIVYDSKFTEQLALELLMMSL